MHHGKREVNKKTDVVNNVKVSNRASSFGCPLTRHLFLIPGLSLSLLLNKSGPYLLKEKTRTHFQLSGKQGHKGFFWLC